MPFAQRTRYYDLEARGVRSFPGNVHGKERAEERIRTSSNKPTPITNQEVLNMYRAAPFRFMREWLHVNPDPFPDDLPPKGFTGDMPLWTMQRQILEKLFEHKKVAAKSGHANGKTYVAALAALTLGYLFKAIVITTAPTFRQVQKLIWGEIHSIHSRASARLQANQWPVLGGKLNQVELLLGPKWYIIGFSTDEAGSFQGFHEKVVFLIIDEACDVKPEIYEAAEGVLTSENSYVLLIGNPTDPTSEFAKAFEPTSEFYPMTISCYDSPNVRHGRNVYPKLVSFDWPRKKLEQWGEQSPMYKSRVLADFPEERMDSLVPRQYIQAALARDLSEKAEKAMSFGLDVARFGDDLTILGKFFTSGKFRFLFDYQGKPTTETTGQVIATYREQVGEDEIPPINVDDIGVGGGVTDMLMEEEIPCNGINVGEAPEFFGEEWGDEEEDEHIELFLNKRAQFFWRVRKLFMEGKIDIDDEELARDLNRIRYFYTAKGKIQIQRKEDFKKAYGYSPDKADCLMLAVSRAIAENMAGLGGWM